MPSSASWASERHPRPMGSRSSSSSPTSTRLLPIFRIGAQDWAELTAGAGSGRALEQYTVLGLLEEQGDATRLPNGFRMEARNVSRLDVEISDLLGLPGAVPGALRTEVTSNATSSHFRMTEYSKSTAFAHLWNGMVQSSLSEPISTFSRLQNTMRSKQSTTMLVCRLLNVPKRRMCRWSLDFRKRSVSR